MGFRKCSHSAWLSCTAVLCSYYVFIVYVREWTVVGTLLHYCRAQCDLLLRVIAVWF